MKQFYVQYLNSSNKLCGEYIAAYDLRDAEITAKNIQGLSRIIDVKEVEG